MRNIRDQIAALNLSPLQLVRHFVEGQRNFCNLFGTPYWNPLIPFVGGKSPGRVSQERKWRYHCSGQDQAENQTKCANNDCRQCEGTLLSVYKILFRAAEFSGARRRAIDEGRICRRHQKANCFITSILTCDCT